jgi:hypothetical protein
MRGDRNKSHMNDGLENMIFDGKNNWWWWTWSP